MQISENVSGADNQQGSLRDPSTTVRRTSFGMMRQSELPSDRKLSDQRLALHTLGGEPVRSRAIEAYKATLQLSDVQREVLVGLVLGDGCLETQNGGRS